MKEELLRRAITGFIFAVLIVVLILYAYHVVFTFFLLVTLVWILLFESSLLFTQRHHYCLFFILYLVPVYGALFWLNVNAHHLLNSVFFVAFAHDTCAYIFGRFFGKHLLWPALSPKKTWQGVAGGLLGAWCICYFYGAEIIGQSTYGAVSFLSFILTFAATAGDLFESWLKRRVQLKDTGSVLPGHGGLLDRLDSVFFLAPVIVMLYLFYHN